MASPHNLMTHPSVELYKELSTDLMNLVISSSNLLVMQKEIDIYTTLTNDVPPP